MKIIHKHKPTKDTIIKLYQYCKCGAVRCRRPDGAVDEWHICELCRMGGK